MFSTLTIAAGIGTLVVSSRGEISWPTFNFGPLLVGILVSNDIKRVIKMHDFVSYHPQKQVNMTKK